MCKITKGRHLQKCRPSVYNLGVKQNNIPLNYTEYGTGYQLCLPINQEIQIPADDLVRLLSAVVERMDLSALYSTYSEEGRNQYSPSVLLKICILGYSRKAISSRAIEQACRENIKYMYLLNGENPPDHNTIARFRSKHLAECQDQILAEMTRVLMDMGEVSFAESAVFIDGTKIESVGNKYKFVWKKSAEKNLNRLQDTMRKELPDMLKSLGLKLRAGDVIKAKHLKKARKQICALMEKEGIQKVSGTGKRQSLHQKTLKKIEDWIGRIERYTSQIYLCGDRSSYCKTDTEATFMRMKEDHMLNGQLKPGYNVNVATVSEYIVGTYVSSDRTDTKTTIPFMEKLMKSYTAIERVVYDSGYESEENYRFFDEHPSLDLYVKPANHEQKKKKKYRTDISRRENMDYNEKDDTYTCAEGKMLIKTGTRKSKTSTGYVSEKTIYECSACKGCPRKAECIRSKSKTPLEERSKRIEVAKYFNEKRDSMESKIMTGEGKQLRMNRSIQAEGVFAYVKTDLSFRRFLTKGIKKVGAEWTLLAMAYNILRMHHKGQNGRLGTHLYSLAA